MTKNDKKWQKMTKNINFYKKYIFFYIFFNFFQIYRWYIDFLKINYLYKNINIFVFLLKLLKLPIWILKNDKKWKIINFLIQIYRWYIDFFNF